MMNMPSSTDPYASSFPPLLPFASLDPSTSNSSPDNQPLWYLDSTTSTHTTSNNDPFRVTNSSYLDCPEPLLPIASFPFYAQEERGKIGLNLGQRTYFSSGDAMAIDRLLLGRAHQPPRCKVEGCKADLSGAKHYHKRHKVCEFHSKAAVVIAGGVQQRFCQQCSRFHVLSEFDEAKRSCRKRLADHNRRRRKLQPSMDSSGPENSTSTTNSKDKSQHTQQNTKDQSARKCSTSAAAATRVISISNARASLEEQQGNQNKGTQMRHVPALSLGVVERGAMGPQGLYQGFSSPSSSSNSFFHHHNFFCSDASQSKGGASDSTQSHQQGNNLLHLGQAMFEVDFM